MFSFSSCFFLFFFFFWFDFYLLDAPVIQQRVGRSLKLFSWPFITLQWFTAAFKEVNISRPIRVSFTDSHLFYLHTPYAEVPFALNRHLVAYIYMYMSFKGMICRFPFFKILKTTLYKVWNTQNSHVNYAVTEFSYLLRVFSHLMIIAPPKGKI